MLFYATQDHLPKIDITHSILGPPPSIINQKNAPYSVSQPDGQIFSIETPFSQMTLAWVKMTKKAKQQQQQNKT